MIAGQPSEAYFVIDHRQRIVQWSGVAASVLGNPKGAVEGRPCYEMVGGRDLFGRAVCGPRCPAFRALRKGGLVGSSSLVLDRPGGTGRFQCRLVALPGTTGGALAVLLERPHEPALSAGGSHATAPPIPPVTSAADIVQDLAALGTLATALSPDTLEQSIERTLDGLRQVTQAEVAELFLIEPRSRDMLLTALRGPFQAAFSQVTRFPVGAGFPGIVLSQEEPVVTRDLPQDSRYLRTRVKEKGFHSYVSWPLRGPGGIVGVLNVAARRPDMNLERAQQFLGWISVPLSAMLDSAFLRVRVNTVSTSQGALADAAQSPSELLRGMLRRMMAVGDASAGAIFLLDRDMGGLTQQVTEGAFEGGVCPGLRREGSTGCPALAEGHGMVLDGPRRGWPWACQRMSARGSVVHCLPMICGREHIGIVQLRYADGGLSPITRHMAFLLAVAEEAARVIKEARDIQQEQARAVALEARLEMERDGRSARGKGPLHLPGPDSPGSDVELARPFLDIRCLGSFELYRQGKLVTPDMVQRRGALTLLKVLLVHGGRPVHRDVLMELMWPETEPRLAANRLNVLVHTLRQVVEPSPQERQWAFICSGGDGYYINTDASYRFDVQEFLRYVELGERLEREGDAAGSASAFSVAVALYRGDFLEEEPYSEWCWETREFLRERYLYAVLRLADLYLGQGQTERSIDLYRRGLRVDALREQAHYGLIRALWLAGRPAEALRQYEACRSLLERELDVAPGAEIERLVHQIHSDKQA